MTIHDAIWVEAPHEETETARWLIEETMISAGELVVPLEVDLE